MTDTHPDPEWWKRSPQAETLGPVDLCDYCGHIRLLHAPDPPDPIPTEGHKCRAISSSLMGNPKPCECTNSPIGVLYRMPVAILPRTANQE